jgi:putative DNA primase/helicase
MPTIELKTGAQRPARRDDYATRATATVARSMATPIWDAFLKRVTAGDFELRDYLQRVAGYCLTGVTTEHVLFFLYGTGRNGKGVFINTLKGIWGGYATTAPIDTFLESHNDRHPTELAGLHNARLVVAQEVEEGRHWAEAKIKSLTGGDPISARFMRQDFFEFTPKFKLMIAGNHKPSLRGVDEAIRARIHLIPFTVFIPEKERDQALPEKLKAEWPGILQWAIDGCAKWQKDGLTPPAAVRDATDEYLHAEDALSQWLEDCCDLSGKWSAGKELWESWTAWTISASEQSGTRKRFAQNLIDRGFAAGKLSHVRGHAGLTLRGGEENRLPQQGEMPLGPEPPPHTDEDVR